jgi:outer membrane protein assembly factor BamB
MAPSPPVVYGDLVVIAPTDAEHIHAFDRLTGRLVWRKPYVTQGMVYDVMGQFLGIANDGRRDVVLMTDRDLRARDLRTGKTVWLGRFDPEADRVLGRGAIAGGEVLVPTQQGLQRFSLSSDGAYRGTVPWPAGAGPGNLLPLARVLVVARTDSLQWFYDWEAIERDVARRRAASPDDPMILIEAGDMYLRGGGEIDRALESFREARKIARRAAPHLEARAVRGLYDAWLRAGDERAPAFSQQALDAYGKALSFAQTPREHVDVRIRMMHVLEDGEARARIANLEAIAEEADDCVAVFDPEVGEVPAKANALFLLTREQLARERPAEAIDALQRVLLEVPDASMPDGDAGEIAKRAIGKILDRTGPLPYRKHEQKAKALLAEAKRSGDDSLLDRILTDYPNAEVVTDALLARARSLVEQDKFIEAATYLQRLLAGAPPDHRLAPTALAALAWTYRKAGARGAAAATLARLEQLHPHALVQWTGRSQSAAAFIEAERKELGSQKPRARPPAPLRAPLEEVHFEPVGDEEYARPIDVATESVDGAAPLESPLALMSRGTEVVAIDLDAGRIAWTENTGGCQRAAWTDGVLVLALNRELRGLDAKTGKSLWSYETPSITRDLQVSGGLVIAQLQDVRPATAGNQSLAAVDAYQGSLVWSQRLPRQDYRHLSATSGRVVLHQVTYDGRGTHTELLVFDAFDGTRRHVIPVPFAVEGAPLTIGDLTILAGMTAQRETRVLAAYDLAKGSPSWMRSLRGDDAVCSLVLVGDTVVVLRGDGTVLTHALATGKPLAETRVYVTDRGRSCPFPGTELIADTSRMAMLPWARRPNFGAVCYDRRTGKLLWEAPYPEGVSPSKASFIRRGDVYLAMVSYPRDRVQNILIRLIDAKSGKVLQQIEPEGLSKENWIPSLVEGRGTVVVFGKTGASIFRTRAR